MLRALVEVAERFRLEGELPPKAYKPKVPKWIVNLERGTAYLEGPYTQKEVRSFLAPDRQRSGTPSKKNLKPYLLLDDARYTLGKAEPGKEEEARLLHEGFLALLEEAHRKTGLRELALLLTFLKSSEVEQIRKQVGPRDLVRFLVDGKDLTEEDAVQSFWARYLEQELAANNKAYCVVCGKETPVLRILPREVVILGQKCQVSSFNRPAFTSFGKAKTENVPTCFTCGVDAVDVLDYLIRTQRHCRTLVKTTKGNSLQNQLAVFWLDKKVELSYEEQIYDLETLLGAVMDNAGQQTGPPAELSQLDAVLAIPWTSKTSALNIDESRFYLAVLSANKGRLVVREWLEASLGRLRKNLRAFLEGQRIIDPQGEGARVFPIPDLLDALKVGHPSLTQDLLRAAYLGLRPRMELVGVVLRRFRNARTLQSPRTLHPLAALLKLTLTYGRKEAKRMERLDSSRNERAYLCGRLLAVLEEAQQRASGWSLNSTLTDRFYAATSAAPAGNLSILLARAKVSHLPKIRREGRGYREIEGLLENIFTHLDAQEGLPSILNLKGQAEFALGYYHQRAEFRRKTGEVHSEHGKGIYETR